MLEADENGRTLGTAIAFATGAVAALGLVAELARYTLGASSRLADFFSLSAEANLPTWYASCLLFACGRELVHTRRVRAHAPFARHWLLLGACFFFMSLDEAVELHEHLGHIVDGRGVFYFSWVIPGAALVAIVALGFTPFLLALPPAHRRLFLIAGGVYVSGALLVELPLGYLTERHGTDNLGYALIDFVEETLELTGASCFLLAVRGYRISAS